MKIVHVAGARPNFVKIASILRACREQPWIESVLVHTGQHYTDSMSRAFFDDLDIPAPDINLEVGSGSHAWQTAEIMKRFEEVVVRHRPDAVLVVGDVNSTVACVLVAVKLGIKTIHVEAGLRSFDRSMPEEINRILTDSMSDILFVSEPGGLENLNKEGIDPARVHFVGNVMIDTLENNRLRSAHSSILQSLGLKSKEYAVITLHRPGNVDDGRVFASIAEALVMIQQELKVVFPIHPRTLKNLQSNGLDAKLKSLPNLLIVEPLGYLDFLRLMSDCAIMLTDSGGIQEETTILGIPCLTLRKNTERPVTVTEGTNMLVGMETADIMSGYYESLSRPVRNSRPEFWDGKASERIVEVLKKSFPGC